MTSLSKLESLSTNPVRSSPSSISCTRGHVTVPNKPAKYYTMRQALATVEAIHLIIIQTSFYFWASVQTVALGKWSGYIYRNLVKGFHWLLDSSRSASSLLILSSCDRALCRHWANSSTERLARSGSSARWLKQAGATCYKKRRTECNICFPSWLSCFACAWLSKMHWIRLRWFRRGQYNFIPCSSLFQRSPQRLL